MSTAVATLDLQPAERPASGLATALTVGLRTVRRSVRTPQHLVLGTVTGAMFLLIFRYVFGGAIDSGAVPYVDFLVPGFVVTSLLFTGGDVAVGSPTTTRRASPTGSARCPCPAPRC